MCVWAVNFHFFRDFDVAGTGAVQCGFPITLFLSFCCASQSRDVLCIQFLVVGFLLKTIQKTSAVSAQANPGRWCKVVRRRRFGGEGAFAILFGSLLLHPTWALITRLDFSAMTC